ncbi:MarR family winged helix-turn-helix transcriptional regulator [Streptacidiphilus sp. EB129]|uniref:MarR family winged helix-turn-helix transcriptional regulator n=1 Tax=Streptacidiphilus sp. EB129 TaxID=3156262 RepID=UPI003516D433
MSSAGVCSRTTDLVEAFTEMGPVWARWVHACLPDDTVSYARLRVLTVLECDGDRTMTQIAEALEVTPRRVTVLVEALEAEGMIERFAHPTDGRSTVVAITETGLRHQRLGWKQHQDKAAVAFGDLSTEDQERLLDISLKLTKAFRSRLAAHPATADSPPARGARRAPRRSIQERQS